MARFDTGHGNLEDVWGDRPAVEQWFLRLHYRRLPNVHLLIADGVQYGARGFVGLQRKVCDVRHPKGNENGRLYIYIEGGGVTDIVRASSSAKDEAPSSTSGAGAGAGASAGAGARAGAGAGAGAGAPKKSARGKSSAFFLDFALSK